MENDLMLIKSAVASGGKQHPLSTERQQQQLQVENHIHYFLRKPNPVPTERAVEACEKSNALFKPNLVGLFRGPY